METKTIDITNSDSETSSDAERFEEKWEKSNEKHFQDIIELCNTKSKQHDLKGRTYKKYYNLISIPLIIFPILSSSITETLSNFETLERVCMITIGLLNGISTFLNYGTKSSKHFEYSNRYLELAQNIQSEILRSKKFRKAFDVYLVETKLVLQNLDNQAPIL